MISVFPYAPCVGSPVLFSAIDTSGLYGSSYHYWSFGDGASGTASSIQPGIGHAYSSPGTYSVWFVVYDSITQIPDSGMVTITVDSVCTNHDLFSGSVYIDANANGIIDAGESKIPGALIEMQPGPYYLSTDQNGDYGLNLPAGSYTISLDPIQYHSNTVPASGSLSVTSTGTSAISMGNNFGVQPISNMQDLRVAVSASPAVPGFTRTYYLYYENVGTTIMTGSLELAHDPLLNFVSASNGGVHAGNTVTWNFAGLQPGASGFETVGLTTPAGTPLGTALYNVATINPVSGDQTPADNVDSLVQYVVGSYDPNDKQVSPAGQGPTGDIAPGTELGYTVRFQNTGTFYATNVVIRDTLDADLDRLSIEILGSSHPMTWHLNQDELVFEFMNIYLPDSNTNEPGSHGWLRYSIDPKAGLPLGTTLENSASIYFDFNAPILTNTTLNTLANLVSVLPAKEGIALTIAPNPFNQAATVRFDNPNGLSHRFVVCDLSGKAVQTMEAISGQEFKLERKGMSAGMYLYRLENEQGIVAKGRLVLQ